MAASTFYGEVLYPVSESQVTSSMEPIEPGLNNASLLLENLLHSKYANFFFALALLASGQSSTITGTYAGQFVMEGFLEWKVAAWKRNLITRSVAIVPSLLVALLAGDSGSDTMIILSQVLLSIQLPFALIPLVKLTNSSRTMGEYANDIKVASLAVSLYLALLHSRAPYGAPSLPAHTSHTPLLLR